MYIDDFIATSQERGGIYKKVLCLAGQRVFTAHYVDSAGEAEAVQMCRNAYTEVVSKITDKLGRPPTERELQRGLALPETQSIGDQLRQKSEWQAFLSPPRESADPIDAAITQRRKELRGEDDPRLSMLQEIKEKREGVEAAKEAAEKKAADPRRPACIQDASDVCLATAFSPDCTKADLRRADFMFRLAKDGDPLAYQTLRQQHQREELQRRQEKAAPLHAQAATLASEIQRLEKPFILPSAGIEYSRSPTEKLPDGLHFSTDQ